MSLDLSADILFHPIWHTVSQCAKSRDSHLTIHGQNKIFGRVDPADTTIHGQGVTGIITDSKNKLSQVLSTF